MFRFLKKRLPTHRAMTTRARISKPIIGGREGKACTARAIVDHKVKFRKKKSRHRSVDDAAQRLVLTELLLLTRKE